MYVTIESLFCSYCDEVAEIFLRLIDTILLASDENELRQGIENLRTRAPLDDYFMDLGDGVRMNLSRNKTSANRLTITLDEETDTYRMRFYRMTVGKHFEVRTKDIAVYEGVYCDMLEEVFTSVTGLYTRF